MMFKKALRDDIISPEIKSKMTKRLFSIRILPRWIIILLDLILLYFSALLSYLLRFNFRFEQLDKFQANQSVLIITAIGLVCILITRSYAGIVRYTGLQDAGRILLTTVLTAAIVAVGNYVFLETNGEVLIPSSIFIINFFVSSIFLLSYRLGVKELFNIFFFTDTKKQQVAIWGTNHSAQLTRNVLENDPDSTFKVVGFIEDGLKGIAKSLNGVRIYNGSKDLQKLFDHIGINELVIADGNISIERKNEIVDQCLMSDVKVRSVPPVSQWVKGELSLNQIREVNIEELLGRDTIKLDNQNVKKALLGKKIMITGAAGSIGSELARQVLYYHPKELILIDQAETALFDLESELKLKKGTLKVEYLVTDISNIDRMCAIFETFRPQVVYHAAAYKHVPMMERNPFEAILCNVLGTKICADLSVKHEVERFVMVSTDKAVNPTSVMGCSKRIAEIYVQSLGKYLQAKNPESTMFITTRFGNVLGSNGSVIPTFRKQIRTGGPVTVTHPKITRFFMTIPEACQLVLEAGVMGKGGEIFVFDMGKSVKILDLAKKMIRLSGLQLGKDIEIIFTGLRNGEKLYEEVLSSHEDTLPTYHHKILIAKTRVVELSDIRDNLEKLINSAFDRDELKLVGIMKFIVPEFISNSSKFEALDIKRKNIS
jgi:FlaA1/EpsC-like NDP-sugar epimerase